MGNTLNKSKIDRIPIPVLPEEEQRAIADVLDTIREDIGVQRQAEAAAGELLGAAGAIFTRGLRGGPTMQSDLGPLPESWSVVDFADVREWLQYGTSTHCTLEKRRYPVLRIPNIEPGRVNPTELKYVDLPDDTAARYLLEPGDLIFIRTNGVLDRLGACAVYQEEPVGALFASYLIRARLKPVVDPRYVAYFYGSPIGTALVAGRATPAADSKYNLNTGTIDSLPLLLPPSREEQKEIVAVFSAIEDKISLHRQKAALLEELFGQFLQLFMSGELRISDLDISVLGEKPAQLKAVLV
jgi:type I restriction enzyme S subunit